MARRPKQPCRKCTAPVRKGERCTNCGHVPRPTPQPPRNRPTTAARGYDSAWQRLRLKILARDPICVLCDKAPSSHVDHIETVRDQPTKRLQPSNLRGLCASCHNARSAQQGNSQRGKR